MLEVEDRFMIKDLHRKGISISDIARQTGHDRKTVRRALDEPLVPPSQPGQSVHYRLGPYIEYLNKRIAEGVLNASKLYDEIKEQGYEGIAASCGPMCIPSARCDSNKRPCALKPSLVSKPRWIGATLA